MCHEFYANGKKLKPGLGALDLEILAEMRMDSILEAFLNCGDMFVDVVSLLHRLRFEGEDKHADCKSNILGGVLKSHGNSFFRGLVSLGDMKNTRRQKEKVHVW